MAQAAKNLPEVQETWVQSLGRHSTDWMACRCSQSYTEKRRGRNETEVAWRIKGGFKRRETDPANNQFPKCSPPSGTHRDSQSWVEKRRGREETEVTWWRKRRVQRGREQSS